MHSTRHLILFLFLLFSGFALSQSAKTKQTGVDQNVQHHLDLSEQFLRKNVDSALFHALAAKDASTNSSVETKAKVLDNLGDIYKIKGDHATALQRYFQAKSVVDAAILKEPNDVQLNLLKSDIHLRIGTLYLQLKNLDKSLFYYGQALSILEKAGPKTPKSEVVLRKLKVYNNMAAVFIQQKDFDMALVYFRNALDLNKTVKDPNYEGSLLNNIGICYLEKKELDLASHYFQQSLKIRKETGDEPGQAQVLNNIGKNEVFKGNFDLADEYFTEALALSRKTGNNESALISLESLSLVNDTIGNYREALRYYKAYKILNDKMFNLESKTAIASLEEKHKRENEKRVYELKLKESESGRLKSQFRTLILIAVLFLLLLIAVLFIVVMRSRMQAARLQQEKLALERENLDLSRKTLEETLEFKEKELTAKALFLLKNNELIIRITDHLLQAKSTFSKDNQQLIQGIITDLRSSQHSNGWDEFELHFTKVHSQFYESLQEKFPTLTSNEKKLCAFLRLNMSTKDISAITNQSVNSITVARTRLRKKLGIDGEDVHLINFLMNL